MDTHLDLKIFMTHAPDSNINNNNNWIRSTSNIEYILYGYATSSLELEVPNFNLNCYDYKSKLKFE